MRGMSRENTRRAGLAAAIMGFALAAIAFYAVRDFLAAFVLFSLVFLALAAALLVVISAEEALVWSMRWMEEQLGRFRARHFALAAHAVHASRFDGTRQH